MSIASVCNFSITNTIASNFSYGINMLFTILGIAVSLPLLWYQIDTTNPIINKVCGGSGNATNSCHAVLSSNGAMLFGFISWGEIGFFYFAGSFLALLLMPQSMALLSWLNMVTLPFILYSLYYQQFIAKKWCTLCLAVLGILAAQFITNLATNNIALLTINIDTILKTTLCFTLPAISWYVLKPHWQNEHQTRNTPFELARLKHNPQLFNALLKTQKQVVGSTQGLGITIGNPQATNTIVKVCNPYCSPCAKAHKIIDELLANNNNLSVQIIFTATNNESDTTALPAKHLLAIAAQGNEAKTKLALDDWYLTDKKDYETFAKKYPLLERDAPFLKDVIAKQTVWYKQNDITYTPTMYMNGYKLPELYTVDELEYFLLDR